MLSVTEKVARPSPPPRLLVPDIDFVHETKNRDDMYSAMDGVILRPLHPHFLTLEKCESLRHLPPFPS